MLHNGVWRVWVGSVALLAATIVLGRLSTRRIPEPLAHPLNEISSEIDEWSAIGDTKPDPGTLRSLDATSTLLRSYRRQNSQLDLFIAFYALQRAGESMHSPKHCLPGSGWEILQRGVVALPGPGAPKLVNKFSIQHEGRKVLMFYWYQSHDRVIADEYAGKLQLVRDTLLTGHTAGSIVRVSLPDTPGAEQKALLFSSQMMLEVQRCLGASSKPDQLSLLQSPVQ